MNISSVEVEIPDMYTAIRGISEVQALTGPNLHMDLRRLAGAPNSEVNMGVALSGPDILGILGEKVQRHPAARWKGFKPVAKGLTD